MSESFSPALFSAISRNGQVVINTRNQFNTKAQRYRVFMTLCISVGSLGVWEFRRMIRM